jgi:hypothetical protein
MLFAMAHQMAGLVRFARHVARPVAWLLLSSSKNSLWMHRPLSSVDMSSQGFPGAIKSFGNQLALAPCTLVDDLMTPVVRHLLPFPRFSLGPQTPGAKSGAAIEAALLDTRGFDRHGAATSGMYG